jgi:hypothetical protein
MKQVIHKRSKPPKPARGVDSPPSVSAEACSSLCTSTSMPYDDVPMAPRAGTFLAFTKSYSLVTKLINLVNELDRLLLFKSKSLSSKIILVNLVITSRVISLITEYFTKVIETYRDLCIPLEVLDSKYDKYISHKYNSQILNSYSKSNLSKRKALNKKIKRKINNKNSNSLKYNHKEEL